MSTSELLNRLEEAAPKIVWKSLSADDWELYTIDAEHKKASRKAASALNKAMKTVAKEVGKLAAKNPYNEEFWGKKIAALYAKHVRPVQREHSDTGAQDTEPHYHIAQGMVDMVKNWYGITGWTDLGDWI